MLPAALRQLIWLQAKARVRRLFRGARTAKGALYLLIMGGLFLLWAGGLGLSVLLAPRASGDGHTMRVVISSGLFAYCLVTLVMIGPDSGIAYSAAEVDFLFPGPFRRRDLVVYRLAGNALGCVALALFFSLMLVRYVTWWPAAFVGVWLALEFITLVSVGLALGFALVAEAAFNRVRKIALVGAGLALAAGLVPALYRGTASGWTGLLSELRNSWTGVILLAPFDVFAQAIAAPRLVPEFAGWGALAAAIDAVLLTVILRLDSNFLETSIRTSQKIQARLERVRSGGGLTHLARSKDARFRVRRFPWLAGAGPVAWRQMMTALRSARGMLVMLAIISCWGLAPLLWGSRQQEMAPVVVFPMLMMSAFFLPLMLQFDFRGDVDRLDVLKSLPIAPQALVVGQLIAPVVMASLVQWLLLAAFIAWNPNWASTILAAALLVPAFNLLLFAVENLVFLIFPYRPGPAGPGDMQMVARQMLVMFVKMIALVVVVAVAVGGGALTWWLGGRSPWAFACGALPGLLLVGVALVPLISLAFQRFDPSLDTPP